MKKILLVLCLLFCFFSAFAYDGVMAGEQDLRIIKTEHFDIIYPERGKDCAALIAANCEVFYTELSELYSLDYDFRLSVTISTTYQGMNAYFSPAPFNHIVLFANQPETSMDVFTNEYLWIFKHEPTHAINYNLKNKFWHNLSAVLGDTYTGGLFANTPFMYEGLAVRTESLAGEGRANDEETLQLIRQAKIEGAFPNFAQVQGSMDLTPGLTASYVFGGYFWQWLTEKYGNEKFTEYIKGCNNLKSIFYARFFKKVFGISFADAWNNFYDEITVPQVSANPADNDFCDYLLNEHNISRYSALCSSSEGIYFYDPYKSGVFFIKQPSGQPVKVFDDDTLFNLSISSDGRYLVTEGYDYSTRVYRTIIRVYDLQDNNRVIFEEYGVSDGTVVKNEYGYFVVYFKYAGENGPRNSSIVIAPLDAGVTEAMQSTSTPQCQPVQLPFGFGNNVFSICDGGDGHAYFLYKNGLKDYICSLSVGVADEKLSAELRVELDFNGQEKLKRRLNGISVSKEKIIFSYTDEDTLMRFGIAERDDDDGENKISSNGEVGSDDEGLFEDKGGRYKIKLMSRDLSGGVYCPALFSNENSLAYIGKFYRGNQVFKLKLDKMEFEETTVQASSARFSCIQYPGDSKQQVRYEIENPAKINPDLSVLMDSRELTPGDLFRKGTFIPISLMEGKNPDEENNSFLSNYLIYGLTYVSASPWTQPLYIISAGYNPLGTSFLFTNDALFMHNYGLMAMVSGSTDTNVFNYSITAQAEGDKNGFKNALGELDFSSSLPIDGLFNFTMSGNLSLYYGRLNLIPVKKDSDIDDEGKTASGDDKEVPSPVTPDLLEGGGLGFIPTIFASAGFTNLHSNNSGTYENAGFKLQVQYIKQPKFENIGLYGSVTVPRLLPVRNDRNWMTYNLPLTFESALFTNEDYFLQAGLSLVLFSTQLQYAAVKFPYLYFNRLSLSASYVAKIGVDNEKTKSWAVLRAKEYLGYLKNQKCIYNDEIALNLSLKLTPNIGGLAQSNFAVTIVSSFMYRPCPAEGQKDFEFKVGSNIAL